LCAHVSYALSEFISRLYKTEHQPDAAMLWTKLQPVGDLL